MDVYTNFIRPVLFCLDPDLVHEAVGEMGYLLGKSAKGRQALKSIYYFEHFSLESEVLGLHFKNPVGIAGGFDKDCRLIQTLPAIGFGFSEVGSITAKPYDGNKRPWNYRLKSDQALLINYGLRNKGVDSLKVKILSQKRQLPLIINIAKTNDPNIKGEDSFKDFNESFKKLQPLADIINLNVSCPNTGDGTLFCEDPFMLYQLLQVIAKNKITKPVILKIKPDLSDEILFQDLEVATMFPFIKGFIISNLTRNRQGLKKANSKKIQDLSGGLAGKPLKKLSNQMIAKVYKRLGGRYPIIGLGGIFTAEDAYEKICLGASLVELATGLIYGGPATIKRINQGLVKLLEQDGYSSISQAVGSKI